MVTQNLTGSRVAPHLVGCNAEDIVDNLFSPTQLSNDFLIAQGGQTGMAPSVHLDERAINKGRMSRRLTYLLFGVHPYILPAGPRVGK